MILPSGDEEWHDTHPVCFPPALIPASSGVRTTFVARSPTVKPRNAVPFVTASYAQYTTDPGAATGAMCTIVGSDMNGPFLMVPSGFISKVRIVILTSC